jgi:hypothetical protein
MSVMGHDELSIQQFALDPVVLGVSEQVSIGGPLWAVGPMYYLRTASTNGMPSLRPPTTAKPWASPAGRTLVLCGQV